MLPPPLPMGMPPMAGTPGAPPAAAAEGGGGPAAALLSFLAALVAHLAANRPALLASLGLGAAWAWYCSRVRRQHVRALAACASTPVAAEYDYVVVGAGSAGSVVANRLSSDGCSEVLVLELGASLTTHPLVEAPLYHSALWGSEACLLTMSTPQAGLMGRRLPIHRICGVGGQAANDAALYVRGNRHDFDSWGTAAAEWNYETLLPYYRATEGRVLPFSEAPAPHHHYRGFGGEITVTDVWDPAGMSLGFVQACKEVDKSDHGDRIAGVDYNGKAQLGAGLAQTTIAAGRRSYAGPAFLCPAFTRRNVAIRTSALVQKVVIEKGKATGVLFGESADAEPQMVRARKEVILAAGPLASPQLLMLSGVGPRDHLEEMGIEVEKELPVGENVQDQLAVNVSFRTHSAADSLDEMLSSAPMLTIAGMLYHWFKMGPFVKPIVEALAFDRKDPEEEAPQLQYNLMNLTFDKLLADRYDEEAVPPPEFQGVTVTPVLLHPKSRGTIRLKSNHPFDGVVYDPHALEEEEDLATLVAGVKACRTIMGAPVMSQNVAEEWRCPPSLLKPSKAMEEEVARYEEEQAAAAEKKKAADAADAEAGSGDEPAEAQTKTVEGKEVDPVLPEAKSLEEEVEHHGERISKSADMQWLKSEGQLDEEEYLRRFVMSRAYSTAVPVGGCKMAEDATGVVDHRLRVKGIRGLRVVDSSVLPTCMSGPSTVTTVALAARAADLIKADHAT